MGDLLARFLPQFLAHARPHLAAVIGWITRRDPAERATIERRIHTLAGDACLLGLTEVCSLGLDCERRIKRLVADSSEIDIEQVVAALRQLEQLIEGLEAAQASKAGAP